MQTREAAVTTSGEAKMGNERREGGREKHEGIRGKEKN